MDEDSLRYLFLIDGMVIGFIIGIVFGIMM
jgi:hypothetical protein